MYESMIETFSGMAFCHVDAAADMEKVHRDGRKILNMMDRQL
jgi:hypothetical protein